jgi:hypothetical protein
MGVDERPDHERHPEGAGGADLGHVHEAIEEEEGVGGLAEYRDHEHQAHPEGVGGDDLGHLHEAIEEEEGPGLGGYRNREP